jgi:hypothetical protein
MPQRDGALRALGALLRMRAERNTFEPNEARRRTVE